MVFEKLIRYAGLAAGLKPSARGCEGRRRGLYRIMYSKTISQLVKDHNPTVIRANKRFPRGARGLP
jgi:hypothetical protein